MANFPEPTIYRDWKEWARALTQTLLGLNTEVNKPLPAFTVANLPPAVDAGILIYVTDETGGAVVAFSDGTDWRRVTDRAVVS